MLNNIDDRKILILSIAVSLLCLIGGVAYLLSQWQYYESGQGILLLLYILGCFVLFFALRFVKIMQIAAAVILLGLIVYYANQKFEWRKSYIDNAIRGNPFVLEEYITAYPSLEEHNFGKFWGAPAWVRFADECVRPALRGMRNVVSTCISDATIQNEYNINVQDVINQYFRKMQSTARRIEEGQLRDKRQYQACLQRKECAFIPLLPADVNPETIDRDSTDYLAIRQAFWSLINDRDITPITCEFMSLCRAMRDISVVNIPRPETM